ncbi:MAG: alpha/beta hydrolase [Dehalococcoidia bacterium]
MPDYTEQKFAASTIELNYAEGPDSGPPLVLLHGIIGRWGEWGSVIDQFAADWHVYAVDLRGHGDSGRVAGGYRFGDYGTEVVEFLRDVIGEPAFLVGHSLGGITTATVCSDAPELVVAGVMEDPPLYIREWFDESSFAPRFKATLELCKKNLNLRDTALELRKMDADSSDEMIIFRALSLIKVDPEAIEFAIDGRSDEGLSADEVLSGINTLMLLIQANPDLGGAMRDVEATRAVDLLEQGRHVKWDDVGHWMHNAAPERYVQLVNAFFRQVLRKHG